MKNSRSLRDLHPAVYSRAIGFIARTELTLERKWPGLRFKVVPTSTLRDDEAQNELYAQGRTKPGKIVTNAKAGDSIHQYSCAMDFAILKDGKTTWDKQYYRVAGKCAQEEGLVWGGDWNGDGIESKDDWDLCHVQYTGGLTLQQLKQGATIA